MADVDDVQGYRTKYENQKRLLDESDELTEADRQEITRWLAHLRTNDSDVESLGTVVGHLNRIRLAAERSQIPLVEFESIDDVNALELYLGDEHNVAESTMRNYKKALKKFFAFRKAGFADEITIGAPIANKHDPDEEITSEELGQMLDACAEFDAAARDKALIALLRDTGLRLGAVLSFRVGDVDLEPPKATVTINTDANVKGASGARPLTWSRGYLANWMDVHPRPDNPAVALIHKTKDVGPDDDGALRQQYAGRRIAKVAAAAGIDPDRIHAHLFRGTAISDWIRQGASEQKIKHRATLVEDSDVLSRYSLVSDEEMNDEIFADHGLVTDADTDNSPELDQCPQCRTALRGSERFCPGCAAPLSQRAADAVETIEDDTFTSARNADLTNEDLVAEFRRRFKSDAEFRERFLDDSHESSSS
jgi:integrase/recombinase XerD